MSNSLYEHDFQVDLEPNENTYCTQDIQWQYINDNNQNNYANGYINFTNLNLGGSSIDKMYSFSNAYITIPYSIVLTTTGGANDLKFDVKDQVNTFAACLKGNHCIVDWVSCKFDGAQLTRSSYHNHLMMNEKIKTYNTDKYKIYGDIMGHAWDNGLGINYAPNGLGEVNNNILTTVNIGSAGLNPTQMVNSGHVMRCVKNNIDITKRANSSLNTFLSQTDTVNTLIRDSLHQNALVHSTATSLVYQGMATIPLSQLHSVFEALPSLSSVSGFDLRLQCNLARENTYTINYPALATGVATPSSITSVQSIGKICPVMVLNPSVDGTSGLNVTAYTAASSITLKCLIGWNVTEFVSDGPSITAPACRIHLPTLSFTSDYIKDIASSPQYSLKYNDYYVDTELKVIQKGGSVSRLFNTQLTRPRILYIIPFLAQSTVVGNIYPSCLTSPLSSSPTTCTPCRLKNFNIQIGGQNIFNEPQQFNYQFYNNNAMSIMADINGNSPKGSLFSGQISKSQWENGYNVYYVNLEKCSDIISDSLMKAFQLTYSIEGNNETVFYDMYYIISYQNEVNLDRLTGKITGINQ